MTQATWPRFMLRLPPDLKRWVDAEAERNGASINSEIIRSVRERMDRASAAVSRIPEDFSGFPESQTAICTGTRAVGEKPADAGEIPATDGGSAITMAGNEKSDDGQTLAGPVVAPGDHNHPARE